MSQDESLKSLLKEALADLKAEIREEIQGQIALATAVENQSVVAAAEEEFPIVSIDRDNPPTFDPNKPRAVWRKIRCAEPLSGPALLPLPGETQGATGLGGEDSVCGRVYNRVVAHGDNPHPVDLQATRETCPKCSGTKWEELARFKSHGPKSPNVTVLKSRKSG